MTHGRKLENSTWRHNPATDRMITTKFGGLKQNHMRRTKHRSKSKSEVKFRYRGCRFSKTGSSFISAVASEISSKFGTHIDFQLFKRMHSLKLNSKVAFRLHGRHREKSIWRHNSSDYRLFVWLRRNLTGWRKITCRWLHIGQNENKR